MLLLRLTYWTVPNRGIIPIAYTGRCWLSDGQRDAIVYRTEREVWILC